METRGVYGIRKEGQDKLTYNHYDSYPEWLGQQVYDFIHSTSIEEMHEIFDRIVLVKESSDPTEEQIEMCKKYTNLSVSGRSFKDWYCLLRDTQGNLEVYKDGLKYMVDSQNFIKDSLFCEYGYIINLDDNTFEVYEGFQEVPNNNRYACDPNRGYYNCRLLIAYPLNNIPVNWIDEVNNMMRPPEDWITEAENIMKSNEKGGQND